MRAARQEQVKAMYVEANEHVGVAKIYSARISSKHRPDLFVVARVSVEHGAMGSMSGDGRAH